jgi:hypothetical protein
MLAMVAQGRFGAAQTHRVVFAFDAKGDIKNGALTLFTYKGGQREQVAVVR